MLGTLGDTLKLKVAQGVVGAVADKGSALKFIPYTLQAVKQGFQDLGASSLQSAHNLLRSGELRFEVRTGAAQAEGGFMAWFHTRRKSSDDSQGREEMMFLEVAPGIIY